MAHVVIVTSEMAGRVHTSCELARRLEEAGHRVTIASPADVQARVEAHGRIVYRLPAPQPAPTTGATRPSGIVRRLGGLLGRLGQVRTIEVRRQEKVDALEAESFIDAVHELGADLLLIDMELPAHVMAGWTSQAPVVVWSTMLALWKAPRLPPLGSSIVPGEGWRGSALGIEVAWLLFRLWKWQRRQRLRITRLGEDQMSVLTALAARIGFPLTEVDRYQWPVPFLYRTLPLLVFNIPELEFPHRTWPMAAYVGPVLNPERGRRHAPEPPGSEQLAAVYERRRAGVSTALIYCSFGSWHKGDDLDFIRTVAAAAAPRPDWDVVIGLGSRVDPALLGTLPGNVQVLAWAPQLDVLAHADIAVHHAGISTVNECIVSGVPMVVYPFDFLDQPGNAARIVYHGLGVRGNRQTDEPATVRSRIEQVLGDPGYRQRVEAMRTALESRTADDPALRFIIARLS